MGNYEAETLVPDDLDALLEPFRGAEKPVSDHAVGTEAEKIGVDVRTGAAIPYDGDRGVATILAAFVERFGWTPEAEYEGGPVLALRRGRASITLEPAGQLELSGAPLRTVHETAAELANHMHELEAISRDLGVAWLGLGFHPFARHEDLPWVPKSRYSVMRTHLPSRSPTGLDMMRRTCTVQANFDYASEDDAMRKLVVSLRLSPIVAAMFANSPFVEGSATGERTHRTHVWIHMDPDRSGLLPFLWNGTPSYRRYVEWALDVPMFIVKRGTTILPNSHQTFRTFLREGRDGVRATLSDWETHLNTLFPEVRLKRILEVRSADSQGRALVPALPALWKGLLYDEAALAGAEALVGKVGIEEVEAARPDIAARALRARLAGREVKAWAGDILELAEGGLARIRHLDADGRDERIHLAPLRALVERGESPADVLLANVRSESFVHDVIAAGRA